jgi:hypothetical protein
MEFSNHSITRQQQRGIPDAIVNMILEFGTKFRKPGNAFEYRITPKDRVKVIKDLKSQLQALDKASNKAVLVSEECIVTAYNLRK